MNGNRQSHLERLKFQRREFLAMSAALLGTACPTRADERPTPYLLGANTAISGYGLFDTIDLLQNLGFQTIELQNLVGTPDPTPGQFPGFRFNELDDDLKVRIQDAIQNFQLVTTHLPYSGLDYFSPGGEQARNAVRTMETSLEATGFFGAKIGVMHPKPGPDMGLKETWPLMIRRIRQWGDLAKAGGFQLALETGYPLSVKDFVRLVHEVDHANVGAAIDVGHQGQYEELLRRVKPEERATPAGIRAYNDINLELAERLGKKLIHFHIHDIEPKTWKEHKPLIHGFIDYPRLIRRLRELDYQGALVFEIGGQPELMPGYLANAKRKLDSYLQQ
ncbi:MAG: sugar phosphate isomerase/epimerase [Pirellulaceae bacterium]|nr:sugar phosphate isomerase/epimerase [Planctomycetaceae bacterium]MDG2385215.1 sugar phosphate isomerase/epimerase [Pirellulaceae bacterium]